MNRSTLKPIFVSLGVFGVVFAGVAFYLVNASQKTITTQNASEQQVSRSSPIDPYKKTDLPVSKQVVGGDLKVVGSANIVDGLTSSSVTITPLATASRLKAGQLYSDNSHSLLYFDGKSSMDISGLKNVRGDVNELGTTVQELLSSQPAAGVVTLQGQSGDVVLTGGDGVAIEGTKVSNTGVVTIQGKSGNVIFSAGAGVSIMGTTIYNDGVTSIGGAAGDITVGSGLGVSGGVLVNTGVTQLVSGSSDIVLTNSGAGTYTIGYAGSGAGGTVALGPNIAQQDATANSSIYINKTGTGNLLQLTTGSSPVNRLVVDQAGAVTAGSFVGNGSGLTGVNASQLSGQAASYYLNATNLNAGTLADNRLGSNVVLRNAASNTFTGSIAATSFAGNGSGVTGVDALLFGGNAVGYYLDASHINTGTLSDQRLSSNVALLDATNNLFTGGLTATTLSGNGSGLTNVNAATLGGNASSYYTNATNLSSGTLADGRLSANVAKLDTAANFTGTLQKNGVDICTIANNCNYLTGSAAIGAYIQLQITTPGIAQTGNLNISGTAIAATFSGNGAGLTSVNAATLGGNASSYYTNATNLSSGTLSDTRLSANVAKLDTAANFTGALQKSGSDVCTIANNCNYLTGSAANGSYVQLQATTPGTAQTGNLNISGTVNGATISGGTLSGGSFTGGSVSGGTLSAAAVNGLTVSGTAITGSGALTVASATNTNLTLDAAGTGSLYLTGYDCSASGGGGKLTVDATGQVICGADVDTDTTGITTITAGNGITITGVNNTIATNIRSGFGLQADTNGIGLIDTCTTSQVLKRTVGGWACDTDNVGTGDGVGATTVAALDGGTANANGATITGTNLYLQSASNTNPGLVNTGIQTFAGAKTFATSVTTPIVQSAALASLTLTGNAASTWSTSAGNLTVQAGSGTVSLGTSTSLISAGALTVTGGTSLALRSTTTGAISLDSGTTGAVNIGTGAAAKTITIGNTTGATAISIQGGTGGIGLTGATTITGAATVTGNLIANSGLYTGAGAGTLRVSSAGALSNVSIPTASTVTVGSANAFGILYTNSSNVLQFANINGSYASTSKCLMSDGTTGLGFGTCPGGGGGSGYNNAGNSYTTNAGTATTRINTSYDVAITNPVLGLSSYSAMDIITNNNSRINISADGDIKVLSNSGNSTEKFAVRTQYTGSTAQQYNTLRVDTSSDTLGRVGIGLPYGQAPEVRLDIGGNSSVATNTANGGLQVWAGQAPGLSRAGTNGGSSLGSGRLFFDQMTGKFKVSENGGAYVDLIQGSGGAASFLNGGNSFGATGVIGTNDSYGLDVKTNNATRLAIDNQGDAVYNLNGYFDFKNGATTLVRVDKWNNSLLVGTTTAAGGTGLNVNSGINTNSGYKVGGVSGITLTCGSGAQALGGFSITGGIVTGGGCYANNSDLAEAYNSSDSLVPGELVMASGTAATSVNRATASGNGTLMGIVSTEPSQTLGTAQVPNGYPIALTGRVPTKVNGEGGAIAVGDKITISSVAGVGKKATSAGMVVGTAVEAFNGYGTGSIEVFVNLMYYNPVDGNNIQAQVGTFGSLNVSGAATIGTLTVTGEAHFNGNIVVNGHIITGGTTPTAVAQAAGGAGSTVVVSGNDTAGTITFTAGAGAVPTDHLLQLTFTQSFGKTPRVIVSAQDTASVRAMAFPSNKSTTGFGLSTSEALVPGAVYTFDYFVVE